MAIRVLATFWLLFSVSAYGSEVGLSQTRSSTALGRRFKFAYDLSAENKISFMAKKSIITADVDDKSSGFFQFGYQHRDSNGSVYSVSLKKSDDVYNYEAMSGTARMAYDFDRENHAFVGLVGGRREYAFSTQEQLYEGALSLGFEHEFLNIFTFGAVLDFENYQATGQETSRSMRGATVAIADVDAYVGLLLERSTSIYLEFALRSITFGLSYTLDSYAYNTALSRTVDVFGDAQIAEHWMLAVFLARGRTDLSADAVNSSGLSVSYLF